MNRFSTGLVIAALAAMPLIAQAVVTIGTYTPGDLRITMIAPRVAGYTQQAGVKAFFFQINKTFPHTCGAGTPTSFFGIDSTLWAQADAYLYRDHVSSLMLAYALDKTLILYVDGCVGTYPRIVGLDIF